jgi:regulator of PEP synthase PpsR (kinase-PPPase family)
LTDPFARARREKETAFFQGLENKTRRAYPFRAGDLFYHRPEDGEGSVARNPVVFVVSDSMGETAQLVAKAVLSQFPEGNLGLRRFSHVETPDAAMEVMKAARDQPTVVIFTVIIPEVRKVIQSKAEQHGIPLVDIMGPALVGMEKITGQRALLEPGLIHRLDEQYFQRVEAVEFAVNHDDGKNPKGYRNADVILIGVSRSSKTPVSMYLANRAIKVANLPLVPEIPTPPELHRVPVRKVVGLTISPAKLAGIRKLRVRAMGLPGRSDYSDLSRIQDELVYAQGLYKELGCQVLDVTDRAVEETAALVLELLGNRKATGD